MYQVVRKRLSSELHSFKMKVCKTIFCGYFIIQNIVETRGKLVHMSRQLLSRNILIYPLQNYFAIFINNDVSLPTWRNLFNSPRHWKSSTWKCNIFAPLRDLFLLPRNAWSRFGLKMFSTVFLGMRNLEKKLKVTNSGVPLYFQVCICSTRWCFRLVLSCFPGYRTSCPFRCC